VKGVTVGITVSCGWVVGVTVSRAVVDVATMVTRPVARNGGWSS
jgi:hypothetical protein